jgi:hypothetical protein
LQNVVVIGYGAQKKGAVTGSVSVLKNGNFKESNFGVDRIGRSTFWRSHQTKHRRSGKALVSRSGDLVQ